MKRLYLNRYVLILALACFALVAAYPGVACANAPKELKLAYDESTQTLRAQITHAPFSSFHYLKTVEVKKNGRLVNTYQFTGQSAETFIYSVKVPAISWK